MLSTARRRRPAPDGTDGTPEPLRVAVLMGGTGVERDVSLVSGREVARALAEGGHTVAPIELQGSWDRELDAIPHDTDVVFIALHGEFGEDGRVQRALARRGFCYTGSGPEASARAFDKIRAKRVMARAGIPLAAHRTVEVPLTERAVRHVLRLTPPGPVVVKPASLGSSVGVVICRERSQLRRALEDAARFGQRLLVEEFIPGHELTCGILGGQALPLVEIVPRNGFYDYRAKYDSASGTRYEVEPPSLPAEVRAETRRIALAAHEALGCEELSRVDLRYDPAAGRIVVLEINTIPGLTPTSLLPKGAAAAGIPFGMLVDRICRLALRAAV